MSGANSVRLVGSEGFSDGRIDDAVADGLRLDCCAKTSHFRDYVIAAWPIRRRGSGTTTTTAQRRSIFPQSKYRSSTGIAIISRPDKDDHHDDAATELGCHAASQPHHVPDALVAGDPTAPKLPHPVTTRHSGYPTTRQPGLQCPAGQGDLVCASLQNLPRCSPRLTFLQHLYARPEAHPGWERGQRYSPRRRDLRCAHGAASPASKVRTGHQIPWRVLTRC